jgi:hypothetical protein
MTKVVDLKTLPVLRGWVALPPAALAMRVTRQRGFQMIEEGKIKSAHRVLGESEEARPAAYLIRVSEVLELAVANCPRCQEDIEAHRGAGDEDYAVAYCTHWQFPEQEVLYDAEPVEHVTPAALLAEQA